ncbi:MAG TPA: glycosyltransferase family 4 protein [Steroidobacteraceae bacterium]|nr:glycosyltransferase family 4 protein [Steroidobacteraceae bacterium]
MRAKRILVLSHSFGPKSHWIDDFCRRADFEFRKIPYPEQAASWHQRGQTTPAGEWLTHLRYMRSAAARRYDGIITCFPQLTLTAASVLRLSLNTRTRLIGWHFNLGSLTPPWKGRVAGALLGRVDRFIVHASDEVSSYAKWLHLPASRFRFVPFQRGVVEPVGPSPITRPYIVSMGSANRDYATLAKAVAGTGIRTVIIAKRSFLEALPDSPELIKLHGLTYAECHAILGEAVINIVPITDSRTASGQVTFLTAMRMGVPTIATRCVGTVDYFIDGQTGLLVPPGDVAALRSAIAALWHDDALRSRLAAAGSRHAEENFSDEAAGRFLAQILDEVL